jgi:hypothetical protein
MVKNLDPQEFGLHVKTVMEEAGSSIIALVMDRKSRISMADGKKIADKAVKIMAVRPEVRVYCQNLGAGVQQNKSLSGRAGDCGAGDGVVRFSRF